MSKRSPPKSRTSLWRDKKARSSELVCQCEYHQEADIGDSSVCQCEYHGSHRNKVSDCCGCEYHSPIDQCQSDYCGCEYHSPVDQCQSDSTSSDSEPSQQSISPNENDVNDRDNRSTNKAPSSCSLLPSESRSHHNADVLNSIPSASKSNLNDNKNGMQHEISVHTLGDVPGDESNSYCEENVGSTTDTTVIANKSTNKAPSSCSLLPSESRSHDYADVSNSSASAFGGVSNYDNNKMQPEIHVDESAGVTAGKNLQQHSVSSSSPDNSPRSSPSYFSEDMGKGLQVHALGENPGDGSNSDREENLHWWQEDSNSEGSSQDGSSSDEPPSSGPELGDSDDSNDPDDPDDPEDGGEEDGSDSSESDPDADMQEGAQNFSLQNERLDLILDLAAGRTTREVVAMVMALAVRSSLDYETVVKIFNILHVMLVGSNLPTTKDQMWSILNRNAAGIRKHVYCSQCVKLLGLLQQLPNPVVCECGWTKAKNKVKYFITLNVRSQLEHILKLPGMWQKLQYPQYRRKRSDEAYEDIIDGDAYKRLRQAEGLSHYDFSFIFNLDGLKAFKKGKCEAWPIFMKLNELPPNLRQKHMILAGVWLDQEHVDFNLFMKTFVKQANKLSGQGLTWKPDGVHEQVSRFFPSCCAADAKARAGILCMAQHVGTYGCTFCEHKGIKLEGSMKYPIPGTIVNRLRRHRGVEYYEQVEIQQGLIRTDESIKNLMQQVVEDPQMRRIRGVTGPAQVMLMSFFDLGNGFSTDDLHPIFLGVAQFHTEILFEGVEDVYRVGKNEKAIITRRLLKSLTPTHISRKPCSIEQMATWKGSEWRNWLLFYAIPCLQGIIPERYLRVLALLTNGIFLLSRDVIEEANLLEAERCINQYLVQFQELYGPQNMRFNIHILSHLVQCVRSWGPLFCHGTMPFESWNHRIGKTVSSPKGAIDQVVMRFLMHALVDNIPQNPDISEEVKEIIDKKILKSPFQNVREVDGAYFFGRSTARNVTERERQALEEYDVENLTEYHQVKVSGMELRSVYYGAELKSNNTFIYSNDDDFGVVEGIVVLEGDNPVGGLFVQLYQTGNPLLGVSHIVPIIHDNDGLVFIQVGNIRNLAVKMNVLDQWYISPMPNQHEID